MEQIENVQTEIAKRDNMKHPSVDVLITFYNQEQFVDHAISSVIGQKGDFELHILAGDDGSSDQTVPAIRKWMQRYPDAIRLFQMPREQGTSYVSGFRASDNRLNLLRHVSSDYFTFLDGDDWFDDENKLQIQLTALEKPENQDCIACGHLLDAIYKDGTRKTFAPLFPPKERKYTLKEYWSRGYVSTDTLLARSSAIRSIPTDLVEHNFNDNLITFTILRQGKLYYIPKAMAIYRRTDEGIWTGSTRIVQNLRNLFLYDLVMRLEPGLAKETGLRFAGSWEYLYRNRREIRSEDLEPYKKEAKEKKLKYSAFWIDYNRLGKKQKADLLKRYMSIEVTRLRHGLRRRIKALLP